MKEAWKVAEALFAEMRDDVAARGAVFYVALGNFSRELDPNAPQEIMRSIGVDTLNDPAARIIGLGEREGLPVRDLKDAVLRYIERNQVIMHGFDEGVPGKGHWNEHGHRIAWETIAAWPCNDFTSRLRGLPQEEAGPA